VETWISAIARLVGSLIVENSIFPSGDGSSAASRRNSTWRKWARIAALATFIIVGALFLAKEVAVYWVLGSPGEPGLR
jgi:hypothetical protein